METQTGVTGMTEQKLFPSWFNPHRKGPAMPATKLFAVFPCGYESEITARKNPVSGATKDFLCEYPSGNKNVNNKLADLKFWVERDFPGVVFERRKV